MDKKEEIEHKADDIRMLTEQCLKEFLELDVDNLKNEDVQMKMEQVKIGMEYLKIYDYAKITERNKITDDFLNNR